MNTAGRVVVGLAFAALAGLAIYYALTSGAEPSEQELLARIERSHPTWQSYYEDLKDQIGAGPVAQWKGTLASVRLVGNEVGVAFRLTGPWAGREIALPVLLRDAHGDILRESRVTFDADTVTYAFMTAGAKPWVEVQSPDGLRRVALPESGVWINPEAR